MGDVATYAALQEYCQDFMDGRDPQYPFEQQVTYTDKASGQSKTVTYKHLFELVQGNTWASYLVKQVSAGYPEYVVVFQGTKANDHSMLQYNMRQRPVFTYIGEFPQIVAEGQFHYMSSLVECVSYMIDDKATTAAGFDIYPATTTTFTTADMQPTFITGHSLGGTAATLFAKSKKAWTSPSDVSAKYPRLVTFGAAPTAYRSAYRPGLIDCESPVGDSTYSCSSGDPGHDDSGTCKAGGGQWKLSGFYNTDCVIELNAAGFNKFAKFVGGISNHCGMVNTQGVRFQHKFDPIPSIAMWKGQYAHQVKHAMLLYDVNDASCNSNSGCAISGAALATGKDMKQMGLGGSNPFMIKDYLCDKWKVEPKAMYTQCYDLIAPYMAMLNPWPCGQILFQRVWKEEWESSELAKFGANGVMDVMWADTGLGTVEQIGAIDLVELQTGIFKKFEDYNNCVSSYEATLGAFIQNAIIDMPDVGAFLFSFSWLHSTYGHYPLCTDTDTSGNIVEINVDASDRSAVEKQDCSATAITTCSNGCKSGAKYSNPWCMEDCMWEAGCYS
jgi:hypothetical protein